VNAGSRPEVDLPPAAAAKRADDDTETDQIHAQNDADGRLSPAYGSASWLLSTADADLRQTTDTAHRRN
jgi:hypothetical protein